MREQDWPCLGLPIMGQGAGASDLAKGALRNLLHKPSQLRVGLVGNKCAWRRSRFRQETGTSAKALPTRRHGLNRLRAQGATVRRLRRRLMGTYQRDPLGLHRSDHVTDPFRSPSVPEGQDQSRAGCRHAPCHRLARPRGDPSLSSM